MYRTRSYLAIVLIFVLLTTAAGAQAKTLFGVKPATMVQSSYIGFLAGSNMVLQFGLDYARVKVKEEMAGDDYEDSINMFMPHGGVRLYLKPRATEQTSPYFMVDLFKAFSSYNTSDEFVGVSDYEDMIGDVLSPWGWNLAFGAEYHFSESFSMGGEYGWRYMMSKGKIDEDDYELSTNLSSTYAAISLNFAF